MRELVLKMSISIDDFVASEDPGSDWMFRAGTPDSAAWVLDTLAGAGIHAVGRRLFETWVETFPTSPSPMAAPVNDIPKVVFSRDAAYDAATPSAGAEAASGSVGWRGTRVASGDLRQEVDRLRSGSGGYVLAQGGVAFARSLIRAGLVDEYRFVVLPVVLGRGAGPFVDVDAELDLRLVSSTVFAGGAMGTVYRPRRAD